MKKLFPLLLFFIYSNISAQAPYTSGAKGTRIISKDFKTKTAGSTTSSASGAQGSAAAAALPDIVFDAPIMITKGGVYSGNWRATDGSQAIQINTTERVEIKNFNVASNGETVIQGYGGSNVYIHDGNVYANPDAGKQYGKINLWGSRSVRIEKVNLNHTGGILVEQWQGTPDSPLVIRYNVGRNTDKRRGDGSAGSHRAFIQLSTIKGLKNCEIAWNQSINIPDSSYIEDNINLYNTSGAEGSPIRIHDNYIQGAHPFPAMAGNFTGSGITADGDPSTNSFQTVTAYIDAYNNQVVDCQNACMNIAAGHNVRYYDNRMICASELPNGQSAPGYWGASAIWDGSNVGAAVFKDNSVKNNVIGYVRKDYNVPFANRQDYVVVNGSPISIQAGDNTSLPNPITKQMEYDEFTSWQKKLSDNGLTIGAGGTVSPPTPPVSSLTVSLKMGQRATGKLAPINAKGNVVAYQTGSVVVSSDDTGIFTASLDPSSETDIIINPVKEGKATGKVTMTTLSGKTITKIFTVEVSPAEIIVSNDDEAVDIRITFTITMVT